MSDAIQDPRPAVGDDAPDFSVKGTNGDPISLKDFRGKKRVVLVFYPQDMTSGCSTQLSAIRATIDDFRAADTEPFGVNEGDAESHAQFISELDLPFDLLLDEGFAISTAYNTLKPEGNRIQRTVVVIGKNGKVIFRQQGAPPPGELLEAISMAGDE